MILSLKEIPGAEYIILTASSLSFNVLSSALVAKLISSITKSSYKNLLDHK